jgi:type IV pilus assembly protein PilO
MAINLSLNRLPWYAQLGAFLGLSAAGAAVFWYVYAQPAQTRIDEQRAKLATLQEEVSRGLETAKRLPAFRREVTTLQAQLDRLKLILPEERDVADLLRRVQAMATQSNLTIRGFTPRAITTRELHAEWPIGLEVEGSYHDLGAFLERISKFPRIINVNAITIRAHEGGGPATVTALATATTFVLIEPAAEETAPARGRGARAGRAGAGRGRAS